MSIRFPTHPAEIPTWAQQESVSLPEAARKYAQALILRGISESNPLRNSLVFKGGNALDFVYLPNRSTVDLDFSFLEPESDIPALMKTVGRQLEAVVNHRTDGLGTVLRLQGIRQNPKGAHFTRSTLKASVSYALPDQPRQRERLLSGQPGANVVPVEMTVNEIVCDWELVAIDKGRTNLQVATPEDIIAEKLRAILQQKVRNRTRRQDILDIASLWSSKNNSIQTPLVSDFLIRKSEAREIHPSRSAFLDPDIRSRSAEAYGEIADTTRHTFIPFDEAWDIVMSLVDQLDIPN